MYVHASEGSEAPMRGDERGAELAACLLIGDERVAELAACLLRGDEQSAEGSA